MSTAPKPACSCLLVAISAMVTVPMAAAATITQTANSSPSVFWNSAIWGSPAAAPTSGNDYRSVATGSNTNIYTINGTTWSQLSWTAQNVSAASVGAASTSNSFAGNSLIVSANAPINWRSTGGSTQSANVVFDGGFVRGNTLAGAALGSRSSTMAGTISFATPTTVAAIGAFSPTAGTLYEFIINSTITGAAGNLLQLTMSSGGTNDRNITVSLTADLDSYFGTIYAGVPTSAFSGAAIGTSSFFSITSDAVNATVQLDTTTTNFRYNLGSGNVSFGALTYGNGLGTAINEGVWDAAELNALTGTSAFFGAGTITVIPEPGTNATLAALGLVLALHRRRSRDTAWKGRPALTNGDC